jgi:uncharacterized coiled-coil protein SlyX
MRWPSRDIVKRLNELATRESKQYRVMSGPIMTEAAEEILRLRDEVRSLNEKIKSDAVEHEAECDKLHDEIARINNIVFKIAHYAADFEDALEIIRSEGMFK